MSIPSFSWPCSILRFFFLYTNSIHSSKDNAYFLDFYFNCSDKVQFQTYLSISQFSDLSKASFIILLASSICLCMDHRCICDNGSSSCEINSKAPQLSKKSLSSKKQKQRHLLFRMFWAFWCFLGVCFVWQWPSEGTEVENHLDPSFLGLLELFCYAFLYNTFPKCVVKCFKVTSHLLSYLIPSKVFARALKFWSWEIGQGHLG